MYQLRLEVGQEYDADDPPRHQKMQECWRRRGDVVIGVYGVSQSICPVEMDKIFLKIFFLKKNFFFFKKKF